MKTYKVEISQTQKYIVDVQAKNEEQAKKLAIPLWDDLCETGTYHLHEYGDAETEFTMVYDVTGTDDDIFARR